MMNISHYKTVTFIKCTFAYKLQWLISWYSKGPWFRCTSSTFFYTETLWLYHLSATKCLLYAHRKGHISSTGECQNSEHFTILMGENVKLHDKWIVLQKVISMVPGLSSGQAAHVLTLHVNCNNYNDDILLLLLIMMIVFLIIVKYYIQAFYLTKKNDLFVIKFFLNACIYDLPGYAHVNTQHRFSLRFI
jgi:hypothetical protein